MAETRLVFAFRVQGERLAAGQGRAAPIPLGARRQDTRLRGLPGQQAVHQRRQCRRQRPCRPHPDGLPEPLASQDLRARGIERPRRVLLLDAQVAGVFFLPGTLLRRRTPRCARYRCSGRRTVSSHRTTGEATPPAIVDRVDIGNNGVITRALQPLECHLPKPLAEAFLIDCLRAAVGRRWTS